jgi:hypothetical protein
VNQRFQLLQLLGSDRQGSRTSEHATSKTQFFTIVNNYL